MDCDVTPHSAKRQNIQFILPRKRASRLRVTPPASTRANERWSMDFMRDTLMDGRPFRLLTVVDTFTRDCLATGRLSGHKVAAVLDEIAGERGYPKLITVDNGSEFYSGHGPLVFQAPSEA